jgi:hypothetical protein
VNPAVHQRICAEIQDRHEKKLERLRAERLELLEKSLKQAAEVERLKEENQKLIDAAHGAEQAKDAMLDVKLPKPHTVMVTNADVGCVELLDVYTADQLQQVVAAERATELTDEQWQEIADITGSIITRRGKDAIEKCLGITAAQRSKT